MEIENNSIISSVLGEEDEEGEEEYEDEAEDEEMEHESRAGYYNTAGFAFERAGILFGDLRKEAEEGEGEGEGDEIENEASETGSAAAAVDGSVNEEESDDEDERTIPLSEMSPYIRCTICTGYFIDATTITECLHTFCKSCIVKHFFYSNRCPKCNVVVHQTQPLYNIRLDRQLQDLVYKLVPHLEQNEKRQLHDFYKERGLEVPKPAPQPAAAVKAIKQKKGLLAQSVFTIPPELDVSLVLEFVGIHGAVTGRKLGTNWQPCAPQEPSSSAFVVFRACNLLSTYISYFKQSAEEGIATYKPLERKYVRVSGEATIRHVEMFIRRKMELTPGCQVDLVCGDHLLERYQSLREVQSTIGESAIQDGLLLLHFGLVLPPGYKV
ncbi:polycomb group RING finger protein 6-like isoform X2 [Acipenser ruthenus]|uniref:polycomb group RING finger protein 6-like isoform X2 n=1 Tax=Acipenser ruthenus TaxID=7906 RepID=UPI002741565B|nr:polycomb group RING finger protein 6-like isoform X2 [Acipenser ruthenus]